MVGAFAQTKNNSGTIPGHTTSPSVTPGNDGKSTNPSMQDDGTINNTPNDIKKSDPNKDRPVDLNYPNSNQSPEETKPTDNTTGTGDKKAIDPTTTTPTDLNKDKKKTK